MNFVFPTLLLHFWYSCSYMANGQDASNFVIEKVDVCDIPNQTINVSITLKTFNAKRQVMDVYLSNPMPLGNQMKVSAELEMDIPLGTKHIWQHMFSAEDDFCRAVQVYFGEIAYDLETAMGLPRGACPIPKGRHHAVNFSPDFSRLKVQAFPFGKIRVTLNITEKPKRNVALCLVVIISNKA